MRVSIIIIGDELLLGQVTDVNSGLIARTIAPAGWSVASVTTVGDNVDDIRTAVTEALSKTDVVLTTGGLGPTKDDITKDVMMSVFGGEPVENADVLENVKTICSRRNIELNELTARQAIVPSSCEVIMNRVGTAPIMWFENDGKVLVAMPGVPFETAEMFRGEVFQKLLRRFGHDVVIGHRTAVLYNITESDIATRLADWENALPSCVHLAYLPVPGYVRLRLDAFGRDSDYVARVLDEKLEEIKTIFSKNMVTTDSAPLPEVLLKVMRSKGLTLSTAESCTGGNIAASVTSVPGSSDVFKGGIVAYSNDVKREVLHVKAESLEQYGAVSLPVVEQMVENVAQKVIKSDCSIATSGIAGPGGGSDQKPVGTVCIAVHTPNGTTVDHHFFAGDRSRVVERTTNVAIIKLIRRLSKM